MGTEKFIGYPLAMAASLALMSPQPHSELDTTELDGAGGALRATHSGKRSGRHAGSPYSPITNPAPPARPAAETPELRALRLAETRLFPEYEHAPLDLREATTPPASCETPNYDLARSVAAEIPAAPDWLKGLERPEIAVPRDRKVAKYLRHFGASPEGRQVFSSWLRRSGAYREIVLDALQKRGLPADLMAVMFVESGCWPKAVSSAGAAGLWQFMPQTARAYGLTVEGTYDERRNIWRSTDAALNHLSDLHTQFQSWHLALAAYNLGYQRLLERMQQTESEDFFTLASRDAIPTETALYVPKILAVAVILKNLEYFGFDDVEQLPAMSASRITVPPGTRLSLLARASGTSLNRIRDLNPQFLADAVPDIGATIYAHLPNSGLARAKVMLPRLLNADGENATAAINVTNDFDWGRDEIEANWKARLAKTVPGKKTAATDSPSAAPNVDDALSIPQRHSRNTEHASSTPSDSEREPSPPATPPQASESTDLVEAVRRAIAKSSTNPSRSAARSAIAPRVEPQDADPETAPKTHPDKYYRIKHGDTLSELARAFNVPQDVLAKTNGLKNPSHILAGTTIRIKSRVD